MLPSHSVKSVPKLFTSDLRIKLKGDVKKHFALHFLLIY